jgi:hypothetical protein
MRKRRRFPAGCAGESRGFLEKMEKFFGAIGCSAATGKFFEKKELTGKNGYASLLSVHLC